MYPQTLAQIDLSYDTADEIQSFDVTFSYSHWEKNSLIRVLFLSVINIYYGNIWI